MFRPAGNSHALAREHKRSLKKRQTCYTAGPNKWTKARDIRYNSNLVTTPLYHLKEQQKRRYTLQTIGDTMLDEVLTQHS